MELEPQIARAVLLKFDWRERKSILDAVRLGSSSKEELEAWGLFCACMSWGGLNAKRNSLISFYREINGDFLDFLVRPSIDPLKLIYPRKGANQLLGLCLAIEDVVEEYGSIGSLVRGENVLKAVFKLAYVLRESLERCPVREKFNLPKVRIKPPVTTEEKVKTNALKRYCMYFRWMVRDEEPDFGIWNFFNKRELFHPIDTHVACIMKRWGVLEDERTNWLNVEKVTNYFRKFEPEDPVKFDYHLVTFGQKFCRKKAPLCSSCPVKQEFGFKCNL